MAFRAPEYQRFEGKLGSHPAWFPIFKVSIQRGWKITWVRRLSLGSFAAAFGLTVMFYMLYKVLPGWRELLEQFGKMVDPGETMPFRIDARFYSGLLNMFIYPVLLPLSVLFGQDLVASDMRTRALEAYFARPLTPLAYLFGRTLAFVVFLLGATLLPMMWVWCFDVMTSPDGHFAEISMVPKGMVIAFGLVSIVLALAVQAVSSVSRSATWTSLSLAIMFVVSSPVAHILHELTDKKAFLAISLPESIPVIVRAALDLPTGQFVSQPLVEHSVLMFALIAVVSVVTLWRQVIRKGVVG